MAEPDDGETDDLTEPDAAPARTATRYLEMITEAEQYFQTYNEKADSVDRLYADLEKMANTAREREMQVFWANLEVLKPSIYARPPTPVVIPRFKDRKALPRKTAELLERAVTSSFSTEDIDSTMRLVRDDLAVNARGVAWVRYEAKEKGPDGLYECVKYDHLERKDFLHEPARKWPEVGWVSRRSWLNRKEGLDRFGDVWLKAAFSDIKDEEEKFSTEQKAPVWELWHKGDDTVVWVTPGVDELLDEQKPYLTLEGFFPCPRPAYGTMQRRTLKPIPEFLYYKDQIEEINELTARISALSEALRLKGFYAAGASELGDAVEAALKAQSNNAILIPVSNFAALGGQALKDAIVWLPVKDVAEVITGCIELRRQLIDDVYQITGLSDIMRGATEPSETLGAQELKLQTGSVRTRERQGELVRIARDLTRIAAEIMAENYSPETLLQITQMEIPSDRDIAAQIAPLEAEKQQIANVVTKLAADPRAKQMAQENPDQAKQALQKAQQEIQQRDDKIGKLKELPTVEQIMAMMREQRIRPFVLDIETDSTIAPDENAQKQRATEFVTSVGGFMAQVAPLVEAQPAVAPLAGEFLKYVASQFRAGRQLEGIIDDFADQMAQAAQAPKPPSPEMQKVQAEMQRADQAHQLEMQNKQQSQELAARETDHRMSLAQQKHDQDMQKGTIDVETSKVAFAKAAQPEQPEQADPLEAQKMSHADRELGLKERSAGLADEKLRTEIDGLKSQALPAQALGELMQGAAQAVAAIAQAVTQLQQATATIVSAATAPKQVKIIRDSDGAMSGGIVTPVTGTAH